jgi:hypothetical protein
MKIALLLTLLAVSNEGQAATAAIPEPLSIHEQIKADRAKAKADEENAPKTRLWDRGANGKRPWETPLTKQ